MSSDAQLVKTLQTNNETLQNINLHFLDILPKFRVVMAHEEMETDMKGSKGLIVDQVSEILVFRLTCNKYPANANFITLELCCSTAPRWCVNFPGIMISPRNYYQFSVSVIQY